MSHVEAFSNNAQGKLLSAMDDFSDPVTFQVNAINGVRFGNNTGGNQPDGLVQHVIIDDEILTVTESYLVDGYDVDIDPPDFGIWEMVATRASEGTVIAAHEASSLATAVLSNESLQGLSFMRGDRAVRSQLRFSNEPFTVPDGVWTDMTTVNADFNTAGQPVGYLSHPFVGPTTLYGGLDLPIFGLWWDAEIGVRVRFPVGATTVGLRLRTPPPYSPNVIREMVEKASPDLPHELFLAWKPGYRQYSTNQGLGGTQNTPVRWEIYQKSGGPLNLEPLNNDPGPFPGTFNRLIYGGRYVPGGGGMQNP